MLFTWPHMQVQHNAQPENPNGGVAEKPTGGAPSEGELQRCNSPGTKAVNEPQVHTIKQEASLAQGNVVDDQQVLSGTGKGGGSGEGKGSKAQGDQQAHTIKQEAAEAQEKQALDASATGRGAASSSAAQRGSAASGSTAPAPAGGVQLGSRVVMGLSAAGAALFFLMRARRLAA